MLMRGLSVTTYRRRSDARPSSGETTIGRDREKKPRPPGRRSASGRSWILTAYELPYNERIRRLKVRSQVARVGHPHGSIDVFSSYDFQAGTTSGGSDI